MKSIISLKKLKRAFGSISLSTLALGLLLTQGNVASGQACLTTSIPINTGYDPATNTVLPIGSQDPHWLITALSPTLTPAQPMAYGAFAVLGNPAWTFPWPISTSSNWISFNTFPSYSTLGANGYSMRISRTFRTCKDDKFRVDLKQFTFDQTIDIYLDNVLLYSNPNTSQYTSFIGVSLATATLPAGFHNLDVIVYNNAGNYSDDGHGLNITGNIVSATGTNSLVRETAACIGAECVSSALTQKPMGETALAGTNAIAQNSPNPFRGNTKIEVFLKTMKNNAWVSVFDLSGKEVLRYPISKTGQTDLTVSSESLLPGIYAYSLFVDGTMVASKRMVVIK